MNVDLVRKLDAILQKVTQCGPKGVQSEPQNSKSDHVLDFLGTPKKASKTKVKYVTLGHTLAPKK